MVANSNKLGALGLVFIVFGAMIGGGIFNIAQNMAIGAGAGAVAISWGITAVGILFLVLTFKILSDSRPDLDAGLYQYAQQMLGSYAGFNIAWGYWLCTAFGNVAYLIIINDSLGAFFPIFLKHGAAMIILSAVLIWSMFFLACRGISIMAHINNVIAAIKFLTLGAIVVILAISFKAGLFTSDFWGKVPDIGSLGKQIESTMLVTLWCFIGIEGAMMVSSRAKRHSDVGRAGIIGFFSAWVLYAVISLLCFGVMSQAQMATLQNPSLAYVLKTICGPWAYYFVVVAVLISLLGGWLSWTVICAQVPYSAASVNIFPHQFLHVNKHDMPSFGLLMSSIAMQVFVFVVASSEQVYLTAIDITSLMVLPCYLCTGIYLFVGAMNPRKWLGCPPSRKTRRYVWIGGICTLYCLWLLYAGGMLMLLTTSIFYLAGYFFYKQARKQTHPGEPALQGYDKWILVGLVICAVVSLLLRLGTK